MMSSLTRRGLLAVLFAATLHACGGCGSKTQTTGCNTDQNCIDQHNGDNRWYCDSKVDPHVCTEAARECESASDCCPSQVCNLQGHFCVDKFTLCSGPGSCTVAGQVCKNIGVRPNDNGCTFEKCTAGVCANSSTVCFNGYCVGEPPCNGGCTKDTNGQPRVCVTATNYCSPAPKDSSGSCQRTCAKGQLLVLHDPDNIFDTCTLASESCECVSLPPLVVRDVSRHSDLALSGQNLYVSAYDGEHGDLVVHTFDKSNPTKPTKSEWLDGLPACPTPGACTLGGDPNGPRGGITNVGPNVGQYTSIAAAPNGDLFVAYYDVDNGDLKFISRYGGPAATWSTPITLDGSSDAATPAKTGDVGLYTSIALTAAGVPAISYFQRASYAAGPAAEVGLTTAVKYIVASKLQPLTRADWSAPIVVESRDRVAPPCNGACATAQVCVQDPNAPVGSNGQRCASPAPTCAPTCSGSQTCVKDVDVARTPVCRTSLQGQSTPDVPQGTGLMTSLAFMDDKPLIVFYDSENYPTANPPLTPRLKAVLGANPASGATQTTPGFPATSTVIDASLPNQPVRDVGRWPRVAIGPASAPGGRIAISYQDATTQRLLLYTSNTLTANAAGNIHVVDDGLPGASETWHPQTFPGVQSALAFTPAGKIVVAFQDGTQVNLLFATWDPGAANGGKVQSKSTLDGATSAAGFYPRVVVDGPAGTAYVSNASIKAATAQLSQNGLKIFPQPAP